MTLRLDGLYDTMAELEERIEDTKILKNSAQMRLITIDNIKKICDESGRLQLVKKLNTNIKVLNYNVHVPYICMALSHAQNEIRKVIVLLLLLSN